MVDKLAEQLREIANLSHFEGKYVSHQFLKRSEEGTLTRDENELTHFSNFFVPFNPSSKQVFFVHHKKAGTWIPPGGHIDKGETILEALNREIKEELGVDNHFAGLEHPFNLSITLIDNPSVQKCQAHYDMWFLMNTSGENFTVDPTEFHESQWTSIPEAKLLTTDFNTLAALRKLERII